LDPCGPKTACLSLDSPCSIVCEILPITRRVGRSLRGKCDPPPVPFLFDVPLASPDSYFTSRQLKLYDRSCAPLSLFPHHHPVGILSPPSPSPANGVSMPRALAPPLPPYPLLKCEDVFSPFRFHAARIFQCSTRFRRATGRTDGDKPLFCNLAARIRGRPPGFFEPPHQHFSLVPTNNSLLPPSCLAAKGDS